MNKLLPVFGLEAASECKDAPVVAGVLGSSVVRMPVSWARRPECQDVRFVAGVLGSKRGPGARVYDLLPVSWPEAETVSWARSGVRMLG